MSAFSLDDSNCPRVRQYTYLLYILEICPLLGYYADLINIAAES